MAKLTWNELFSAGKIVDLESRMWTARTRILPADIGITDTAAVASVLALGSAKLAPKDAFDAVNACRDVARRTVHRLSMPFPWFFGTRFVPTVNLAKLGELLDAQIAEYNRAVDDFVAEYDATKRAQAPIIRAALADAVKGRAESEALADAAFERFSREYPSAEDVREKFLLRVRLSSMQSTGAEAISASLQAESDDVRDMVATMATSLRDELAEKVGALLAIIAKGGKFKQASIDSAVETLDKADNLNILGDPELAKVIAGCRRALSTVRAGERVTDGIVDTFKAAATALEGDIASAVAAAEKRLAGNPARVVERAPRANVAA